MDAFAECLAIARAEKERLQRGCVEYRDVTGEIPPTLYAAMRTAERIEQSILDARPPPPEPKIMGEEVEDDLVQRMRVEAATCETNAKFYEYPLEVPSVLLVSGASEIESLRASLTRVEEERDEKEEKRAMWDRLAHQHQADGQAFYEQLEALKRDVLGAVASVNPILEMGKLAERIKQEQAGLSRASPTETERSE